MSHGLPDLALQQSTQHKVILHGLWEVASERQVISHDPSVTSMVLMVRNGRKCITCIYYIIEQLLSVSVDMECYLTVNLIILTSPGQYDIYCSITLHVHLKISQ